MNILLADNTALFKDIFQNALAEHDVQVVLVKSIAEAIEKAGEQSFQFFILASQLADGEGVDLCRRLRDSRIAPFQPIVLLTANPSAELAERANIAGATELFRKQDIEELITFMQRFLKVHRPLPCKVLYIEDARDQRQHLSAQMQEWGMEVDAFDSADAAWEALQANAYDLIVCDIVLGGRMSGSRFINRVRRQPEPIGNMLVLAATAFDNTARRIELFHLGIDDYVVKPIVPLELKARIQHLLARKESEEALNRARQMAEEANRAKSSFLANMSHEIRTPLNAISGLAHLMRRENISGENAERLAKIEIAGEHLLEIVNAILDLSKIEAGKFTLEETPFSIKELLENVASMVSAKAAAKGLAFAIEADKIPECLCGDRTRLQQALLNYLANAVKFTDAGSVRLIVRAIGETRDTHLLRFEVVDTGPGIPPEALPRLFNSFEQADNSITRRYGGTGLGLAITRKIAELMGGEAGVTSVEGEGSTFWLSVRVRKFQGEAALGQSPYASDLEARIRQRFAGRRVLLAEDEPVNREIAVSLLNEVGLIVDVAVDGGEALQRATDNRYDLILMDMQMPLLDGLEATRRIRRLTGERRIPIVAMTANAFAEDKVRCMEAGMDDFITKPVNPDYLFQVIWRWLLQAEA